METIHLQGLPISVLGVIAATVTITMTGVALMLKIASFLFNKKDESIVRDDVQFQTKTVLAMERIVKMCDSILAKVREHNDNSAQLVNVLERLMSRIDKGFEKVQNDNNTIQRALITQNGQFHTIIDKLIKDKDSVN